MIGALAVGADMRIDLGIALDRRSRRELDPALGIEGLLGEDLAGEAAARISSLSPSVCM